MNEPAGPGRPVGWYVHHHGFGHLVRAVAVAPLLAEMVVLSSLPRPLGWERGWIELPRDDEGEASEVEAGGVLHWAPLGDDGLKARTAAISAWIEEARPGAFVVDVSVEVALLARLHGVPTVVVGQRGRRDDQPHSLAFAAATSVVVPWTEETHLAGQGLPDERLAFLGAISRFGGSGGERLAGSGDRRPEARTGGGERPEAHTYGDRSSEAGGGGGERLDARGGDVLVLLGFGGSSLTPEQVVAAAAGTPERTWHLAGPLRAAGPPNLLDHGADAPVAELLDRCSVVVGAAGGSTIAEVAAARRHFLCVPERRPFEEQRHSAIALGAIEAAEVQARWPGQGEWGAALAAAEARPVERWARLEDGRGAERMVAAVRAAALS